MQDRERMLVVITALFPILVLLYMIQGHPLAQTLILFVIAGTILNLSFLSESLWNNLVWIIALAAAIYKGLSLLVSQTAALATGYAILLTAASVYAGRFRGYEDWDYMIPLFMALVGVAGSVLAPGMILWIIASPVIELMLVSGVSSHRQESIGIALVYGIVYVLAFTLPPIALIYTMASLFLRTHSGRLRSYKTLPLDTALRLAVGVTV